jgi:putative PIN family toxin of toxin-antitoxin system
MSLRASLFLSMKHFNIVLDTNVIVSAFKSRNGASYKLVRLIGKSNFTIHLSTPLFYEYEEQLSLQTQTSVEDIEVFLAFLFRIAQKHPIYFRTRPLTKDADDDMLAELAFACSADCIVTYNKRDFKNVAKELGIGILTAKEFLHQLGEV